ncbi:putative pumilio [Danaus plexippus plexippus]|uniref:Pumilio n=1 Tax=Danaus plexippus plexippus TaxID=278856 RepID=A0A212ENP0_DANPL|nr:putative pumilio [Danaus plexippus plexippus]
MYVVTGACAGGAGGPAGRRDSLEFGGGLQDYTRKWGPSPLSPPLGALGPVGLRPVSAAPGAETAKYRVSSLAQGLTSNSGMFGSSSSLLSKLSGVGTISGWYHHIHPTAIHVYSRSPTPRSGRTPTCTITLLTHTRHYILLVPDTLRTSSPPTHRVTLNIRAIDYGVRGKHTESFIRNKSTGRHYYRPLGFCQNIGR